MTAVASPSVAERGRAAPSRGAGGRPPRPARRGRGAARLAGALDERFDRALELLAAIRGRVVVTGMGKSGHVARKIAATFASTGTPSLYVHPAEASHGDLGMITANDVVLALSNSGETPELADIVAYTRRFSIPLLAIIGRADQHARPTPPISRWCCRSGRRPARWAWRRPPRPPRCWRWATRWRSRCSSAAASARRISACCIPGGKLGKKLMRVDQLMHRGDDLPLVGARDPDDRGDAGDDRQAARLRRRARRPRRARRASSPTAICAAT